MAEPEIIKAHCPDCGDQRRAFVRGKHRSAETDDDDGTSSSDTGFVLECCGCGRVFFRRDVWFSEWEQLGEHPITGEPRMEGGVQTTYWPSPVQRKTPEWVEKIEEADPDLGGLLAEMYAALNNDLRLLAAIGARTAFDRASELLGVDASLPFRQKLEDLVRLGKMGTDEQETIRILVDAGSAAAHRGWRPKAAELNTMMDVVEAFLYRSFIVGDGIAKLKASVPARPPKVSKK
jgi:hypothetical protein